ncbi:hypothetical protein DLAC_11429 [Tieghemostelium lacteum]|uniref:Uncharacterized protein n=1 Tax=Tieghemostelium lacteum TaxID=361077 RepID=A0A152A8K5_TIELA|nr:hypothetical protein DLAC_11429 [Tieghemostelium lacteum]|eukprot:KYR02590.1 hypothetical protein DLAC_11429 [Tieghemostelium lacteum]
MEFNQKLTQYLYSYILNYLKIPNKGDYERCKLICSGDMIKRQYWSKPKKFEYEKKFEQWRIWYGLVCKQWMTICLHIEKSNNKTFELQFFQVIRFVLKNRTTSSVPTYKIFNFNHSDFSTVKHLNIDMIDIRTFVASMMQFYNNNINETQHMISLDTITIYYNDRFVNLKMLDHLNRLTFLNVEFNLLGSVDNQTNISWEENDPEFHGYDKSTLLDQEFFEIKNFKTNHFYLQSSVRYDKQMKRNEDIGDTIRYLDPKSLKLVVTRGSYTVAPVFLFLSKIAKLNHRYESIVIYNHPITLLAFYRFLQSPRINKLCIQLQFHQIFSFYNSYKRHEDNVHSCNYNIESKTCGDDTDDDDIPYQTFSTDFYNGDRTAEMVGARIISRPKLPYIDEIDMFFCPISKYQVFTKYCSHPPYCRDVWNKSKDLLKNHQTLKHLELREDCMSCSNIPPKSFIDDLVHVLGNNKSIVKLKLDLPFLTVDSIKKILDQNTTLEHIILVSQYRYLDIQTTNLKCKVSHINYTRQLKL